MLHFLKIPEEFVVQELVGYPDASTTLPDPLDMSSASASTDASANTSTDAPTNASANAYQDECPICLDSFEKKHKTDCGHFFCYDCMHRLLNSTLLRSAPCPICRSPVTFQTFHSTDPVKKKSTKSLSWLKVRKI